ncbi:MAG: aldo/keto reductase [Limisphaerales bacterium]
MTSNNQGRSLSIGCGAGSVPWRQCGKSALRLPVLGVGCWAFGGGEYWGAQSQHDVEAVVRSALEHGCGFFDTAEAYNDGASESSLGLALRGITREKVIVASKISPSNAAPEKMVAHCEASLRRLQTDYIDLYMVHWPMTAHAIRHFTEENLPTPSVPEAFATLERLRQSGKIRHIGVSNFGAAKLAEALATGVQIAVNELPYNLLCRAVEIEVLPFCRDKGLGILGYMSLLQGVLSDHYPTLADLPVWHQRTRHFSSLRTPHCRHGLPGAEAQTTAALESIRAIARKHGMTTSELALKWAFAGDGITSSLCGARNLAQLQSNIMAASEPLPREIIAELNRATAPLSEELGPSFDYYENPSNDRTK